MDHNKCEVSFSLPTGVDKVAEFLDGLPVEQLNLELYQEDQVQWDGDDDVARTEYRDSIREMGCVQAEQNGVRVVFIKDIKEAIVSVGRMKSAGEWQFMDFDGFYRDALASSFVKDSSED